MQKDDLNKYHTSPIVTSSGYSEGELARTAGATAKTVGGMVWKSIKTVLIVVMLTGLIVFISVASFILSFKDSVPPDISTVKLSYTSFVKVENKETGEFEDYLPLYSSENRVWVNFADIPQAMIDAIIAIEDQRFYQHKGVDWYTTLGATYQLATGGNGRGGSTLTQQLIKNLTGDNDVSILRKIKEIFMALNLESDYYYTKDDILEAYLNLVNFGGSTMGVQAAANLYFGKDIGECDIAECASIAGITQYPYLYNPLINPDENKVRQQTVIQAMYDQKLITTAEYTEAMEKSEHMVFANGQDEESEEETSSTVIWNWYIETMIADLIDDLSEVTGLTREIAKQNLYNAGYEIYCAMDEEIQLGVEELFSNEEYLPNDIEVWYGVYAMDYDGKTIAVVGSRQQEKTANSLYNYATQAYRQTGSSIKALSVYAAGIEEGYITYGSVLKDQKIENYFSNGKSGPENFSRTNKNYMNVDEAVEISQNMPAAQLVKTMGVETSFNFLVDKLHFKRLTEDDKNLGPLALGGFTTGATVREMTAGFQIFGNGGVYNEPYTYYYVKDHDGNVILDNRAEDKLSEQVMTEENAGVMNKLLHKPIYGTNGTGKLVQIDGLDIFGKTGTSSDNYDLTFYGGSEICVAGIWNGYPNGNVSLTDSNTAKVMWRALMNYLYTSTSLSNSQYYKISDNIVEKYFCRNSGLIAGSNCYSTTKGWYANTDYGIPDTCNGGSDHTYGSSSSSSESSSGSESSATATPSASAAETPAASSTPNPNSSDPSTTTPTETPTVTVPPESTPSATDQPAASTPSATDPPAVETPRVDNNTDTPAGDDGGGDE